MTGGLKDRTWGCRFESDALFRVLINKKSITKATLHGNRSLRTFNGLERELLRYCKCDGKVTFTILFLMLGKVTFDEHVNVLEGYCKGDIS